MKVQQYIQPTKIPAPLELPFYQEGQKTNKTNSAIYSTWEGDTHFGEKSTREKR